MDKNKVKKTIKILALITIWIVIGRAVDIEIGYKD